MTTTLRLAPLPLLIAAALTSFAPQALASPECPLADAVQRSALRELCPMRDGLARFSVGRQWGFVDAAGRIMIAPQFDELNDFSEGYATARVDEKWGLIDRQGKWAVQPAFSELGSMSGGLLVASHEGKDGFIDASGKWVIPAQFDGVDPFAGEVAVARQAQRFMLIDKAGRVVKRFPDNVSLYSGRGKEGMFEAKLKLDDYLVNIDGRRHAMPAHAQEHTYANQQFIGATRIKRGEEEVTLHGLMDMAGKWLIPAQFRELAPFNGKLAIASPDAGTEQSGQKGQKGLIDQRGAFVVQPMYDSLTHEKDGFYRGRRGEAGEKLDLIDSSGKLVFTLDCAAGKLAPAIGKLVLLAGCGKTTLAFSSGKVVTSITGEVEVKTHGDYILLTRDGSDDEDRALLFELYDSKGARVAASDPAHKLYGQGYHQAALLHAGPPGRAAAMDLPIALFARYSEPSSITLLTREHKLVTRPEWKYESELLEYTIRSDEAIMEGPLVVHTDDGVGAVDAKGNWVVAPTFSRLSSFEHGLAYGTADGARVVVDATGKTYPFPEQGYRFSRSAPMTLSGETDEERVTVNLRTGAVTKKKRLDIDSGKLVDGVMPAQQDRKWGLMDASETWLVKPAFDKEPAPVLKGGQLAGWITSASVETPTETDDLYGLLDARGREIHKPRFTELRQDQDSGLLLASENDFMRSVLDTNGKTLVAPIHADLTWRGDGWFTVGPAEQHGLVDQRGEWVVKPSRFEFELRTYSKEPVRPYARSYAGVDTDFMDLKGRISTRSAPLALGVEDRSDWWVHEEKRGDDSAVFYGFDFKPRVRLPGATLGAGFVEQRIAFRPADDKLEGKLGLADDTGKVLGMYELSEIESMSQGMARVRKMVNNPRPKNKRGDNEGDYLQRTGYMNHAGKIVVAPVFDAGADFSEQRATVVSKGALAMIDDTGKIVLQGSWQCGRTPVLLDGAKKVVWPEAAKKVTSCKH